MPTLDYGKYFETDDTRPVKAWCDDGFVYAILSDGRQIKAPLWWYPYLEKASVEDRAEVELEFVGIWWPRIDEGVSVKAMLLGWKAPGAVNPSHAAIESLAPLSIGMPLPLERKTDEYVIEGAHCLLDYRSRIHERVIATYEHGRRYVVGLDYDRFFAATDTLLDVGNILHVAKSMRWPKDETTGQLWMYGALQALIVEQDACGQLLGCFGVESHPNASLTFGEIRELRVAAVGHPASHIRKTQIFPGCTYLAHREHGSLTRFNIVTLHDFKKSVHRVVDILALIAKQRTAVELDLAQVWQLIRNDSKYERDSYASGKESQ